MVHVPLMFLSEWREFPSAPCLAWGEKNSVTARVSMMLKSRASPDILPFSLCYKTCNSAHEQTPVSNDTIDSVLRHREVGRAKDLLAPPRMTLTLILLMCRIWWAHNNASKWQMGFNLAFKGLKRLIRLTGMWVTLVDISRSCNIVSYFADRRGFLPERVCAQARNRCAWRLN